jgi:hypothetical protein
MLNRCILWQLFKKAQNFSPALLCDFYALKLLSRLSAENRRGGTQSSRDLNGLSGDDGKTFIHFCLKINSKSLKLHSVRTGP